MAKQHAFRIETIGEAKIPSPIQMSAKPGDGQADYVEDSDKIYLDIDHKPGSGEDEIDLLELAGPRKMIYFNPKRVHAAICTCGGICPGLNNVIRSVVRCFWYRYGVRRISGIPFGYLGLLADSPWPMIELNPDVVYEIQEKGGTILGSARGGGKEVEQIVDTLERENINILITIGALPDYSSEATLEYISPKAVESNGANQFEIKAAVKVNDQYKIRSGYSANAEVVLQEAKDVVSIPESCLEFDGDDSYVYLKGAEQEYVRTAVTTGLSDGVNIEIKSGLKAGDKVRGPKVINAE